MAHLWTRDAEGAWVARAVAEGAPIPLGASAGGAMLIPCRAEGAETWALLSPPEAPVRLNGSPLPAGIAVLRDRDEVRLGGAERLFFSTEHLARVVPFPGSARETVCPRCRLAMPQGAPAVQCPRCGVWHHQSEQYPCWTYSPACALCDQPTDLSAGYSWTPEGL